MNLNISDIYKKFQKVQENINDLKNETENLIFYGKSDDEAIEVSINGRFDPIAIKIDKDSLEVKSKEDIEKSILIAMKKAKDLAFESYHQKLKNLTGGIQIPPGLDLPL